MQAKKGSYIATCVILIDLNGNSIPDENILSKFLRRTGAVRSVGITSKFPKISRVSWCYNPDHFTPTLDSWEREEHVHAVYETEEEGAKEQARKPASIAGDGNFNFKAWLDAPSQCPDHKSVHKIIRPSGSILLTTPSKYNLWSLVQNHIA